MKGMVENRVSEEEERSEVRQKTIEGRGISRSRLLSAGELCIECTKWGLYWTFWISRRPLTVDVKIIDNCHNNDVFSLARNTRKPCYRKDDRAMRPIYGCPEKCRESSQTPPATFPEICKGFLFRSILRMCIQNLKFVALSVREIIGVTQKIWAVPRYAHAPFSLKFLKGFCSDGPC